MSIETFSLDWLDGFGTIRRDNEVFDPASIDVASLEDLSQAVDVLAHNRFQRIPIKGLDLHVTIEAKRHTATIERIFVRKEKFEPGETVDMGVVLRPYRGEPFTTTAQIKVPEHAVNGRAVLMVSGGPARFGPPGVVVVGGSAGPPPAARHDSELCEGSEQDSISAAEVYRISCGV